MNDYDYQHCVVCCKEHKVDVSEYYYKCASCGSRHLIPIPYIELSPWNTTEIVSNPYWLTGKPDRVNYWWGESRE